MDTYSNVFDIAIVLGGIYMIYAAQMMKLNDIIKVGVILPPTVNVHTLTDREAFKKYAYPRHLAEGMILVLLGMVGIGLDLYGYGIYHAIIYAVVLVVWIVFYLSVERGKRRFYSQNDKKQKK